MGADVANRHPRAARKLVDRQVFSGRGHAASLGPAMFHRPVRHGQARDRPAVDPVKVV
jgi:hypothetical protein